MKSTGLTIRKKQSLADQLYGQIFEQMISGTLQQGEKLPPEVQLSHAFGVSRPVVREALARLQDDGLVDVVHGVGRFVRKRPPQQLSELASADALSDLMRGIEARMVVERATARFAAQRAVPDSLKKIKTSLLELEASMQAREPATRADYNFHLLIAEASGNHLLHGMLLSVHENVERIISVTQRITRDRSQERIDRVAWEHRQIYEAIAARDAEAAELSMAFHLTHARQRVIDSAREA